MKKVYLIFLLFISNSLLAQVSGFDRWLIASKFYEDFNITSTSNSNYYLYHNEKGTGLIDSSGTVHVPNEFEHVEFLRDNDYRTYANYFLVHKDEKQGLYTKNGVEVLSPLYDYITQYGIIDSSLIIISKDYQLGCFSLGRGMLLPTLYKDLEIKNDTFYLESDEGIKSRIAKAEILNSTEIISKVDYQKNDRALVEKKGHIINDSLFHELKWAGNNPWATFNFYRRGSDQPGIIQFTKDGKWGVLGFYGDTLLKPTYDKTFNFSLNHALVVKNGLYGLVNKVFDEIVPAKFDNIEIVKNYYSNVNLAFIVRKEDKYGVYDSKGKIIVPFGIHRISLIDFFPFHPEMKFFYIQKDNQFGVINLNGDTLVPVTFDKIDKNIQILSAQWQAAYQYSEFWYPSLENGDEYGNGNFKWYNDGMKAKLASPNGVHQFLLEQDANIGLPVKKDNNWGFYSMKKGLIIPRIYDSLYFLSSDIVCGIKSNNYMILNIGDTEFQNMEVDTIFPLKFNYDNHAVESWRDPKQLLVYRVGDKYGVFDPVQKLKTNPIFDEIEISIHPIDHNVSSFFLSEGWPKSYNYLEGNTNFHNGHDVIRFKQNRKYGLFNTHSLRIITSKLYDSISFQGNGDYNYSNEIIIQLNDKMTFLTENKNGINPIMFDSVEIVSTAFSHHDKDNWYYKNHFMEDVIIKVRNGNKVGLMDTGGKEFLPMQFQDLSVFNVYGEEGMFIIAKYKGKFGVLNSENELFIPYKYDQITFETEGEHKNELKLLRKRKTTWVKLVDL